MTRFGIVLLCVAALAATAFGTSSNSTSVLDTVLEYIECAAKEANTTASAIETIVANTRKLVAEGEKEEAKWKKCGSLGLICKIEVIDEVVKTKDAAQKDLKEWIAAYETIEKAFETCISDS